jgi:hypothetical protein
MSARSFPLHRWQHRGPHHTMCRSLHCAYLMAHHTPALGKGNPYGSSVGCFRGSPVHTASGKSMGVAWGGEVWRFAVPRISLRLRHGRMGHGRRWLRRPGPSPGSGWLSTTPGLHRVRTHHDRCDALWSETSRPQYPVPCHSFKPTLPLCKRSTTSALVAHGHQESQQDNAGHPLTSACTCGDTASGAE